MLVAIQLCICESIELFQLTEKKAFQMTVACSFNIQPPVTPVFEQIVAVTQPLDLIAGIPDRYNDLAEEDVGDLASDSFLINGRGRYAGNSAPLTIHRITAGQQYLFRFINTGFDNMFEVRKVI